MNRCPVCGGYMRSFLESAFGITRTIYSCSCGYMLSHNNTYTASSSGSAIKISFTTTTEETKC